MKILGRKRKVWVPTGKPVRLPKRTKTGKPLYHLGAMKIGDMVKVRNANVARSLCHRWNYHPDTIGIYEWYRDGDGSVWIEYGSSADAA